MTEHDRVVSSADARRVFKPLGAIKSRHRVDPPFTDPARAKALSEARSIGFLDRWSRGHTLGSRPLITLLIDHSGSMRGEMAMGVTVLVETVGRALETLDIGLEILGFTTPEWKGGLPRRWWLRYGEPRNPGRLNALLHIVYRGAGDAHADWAGDLNYLMNSDVLKENIDGEALEWAWRRANDAGFSTWLCVVISDGAPVDDSTLTENARDYLERHLRDVIGMLQGTAHVRLGALGIGFAVDRYYGTSSHVADLHDGGAQLFDLLEWLIWGMPETAAGERAAEES